MKIGEKKAKKSEEKVAREQAAVEANVNVKIDLDERLKDVDFAQLYEAADAEKTTKTKRGSVTAAQIRYVRDKYFDQLGHTEMPIAMLAHVIDKAFGLKKDETTGVDNRVENSSVRSACTAEGKYEIITVQGAAVLRKAVAKV